MTIPDVCKRILSAVFTLVLFFGIARAGDLLETKAKIVSQGYCSEISTGYEDDPKTGKVRERKTKDTNLKLKIEFRFRNTGKSPLILEKDFFILSSFYFARSRSVFNKGKYFSTLRGYFTLLFNSLDDESPPPDRFVILPENGEYFYSGSTNFALAGLYLHPNRKYFMGVVLYIWGGQKRTGIQARERWKDFGYLWLDPVVGKIDFELGSIPKHLKTCD